MLARSKWFCDRYDKSLKVMWSRSDSSISTESIEAIRSSKVDKFTDERFRAISADALRTISSKDIFSQWRKAKGTISCAVVGNSDNLSGSDYGLVIDSHDVVFRMNAAATKGYGKDVGVKTTFQTLYSCIANSYQKPNKILVIPTGTREIHFAGRAPSILRANSSDVYLIHPDLYRSVKTEWMSYKKLRISSGIVIILFAVHVCNKVNVFGFGINKDGNYGHYYSLDQESVSTRQNLAQKKQFLFHDFKLETDLRMKLAEEGIITVFPGAE
ncbi:CMP-N-acetylneuraminate-beta-galactosamide-alpha-2,3-sialyltransferase 2-like isoform X3 [Oscarella lobularis]